MHRLAVSVIAAALVPMAASAQPQRPQVKLYDAPGVTRACDATLEAARKAVAAMEAKAGGAGFFAEPR